ncbi:hypothetical protein D9756_002989 [Leucocoprinus leucothites]|uniref:Uncharacterized protein n=1 Tax=Leucocoprinus leucothites TaxID=201217 RepID=A0A8H5LJ87_9AGAR|nr:hypothetical protein D9756_002989 [Leucoagaricus leucothites]
MTTGFVSGGGGSSNSNGGGGGSGSGYSRFHAIISATPTTGGLSGLPPRPLIPPYTAPTTTTGHPVSTTTTTPYTSTTSFITTTTTAVTPGGQTPSDSVGGGGTPSEQDHYQVHKKRKITHDVGNSSSASAGTGTGQGEGIAKALRNANKNESVASRQVLSLPSPPLSIIIEVRLVSQRPHKYTTKASLLTALAVAFQKSAHVDFHGCFEENVNDLRDKHGNVVPPPSHKARVQALTGDIWEATGYRFTVKDHPRISSGHKTRFWCSQDEAHRSKSSKLARLPNSTSKPRISSAGEALAKARYACRSRLLISSRDAESSSSNDVNGLRVITIRMHHHATHEPYVENSLPPELAQAVYEYFGWSSVGDVAIMPLPSSHLMTATTGMTAESLKARVASAFAAMGGGSFKGFGTRSGGGGEGDEDGEGEVVNVDTGGGMEEDEEDRPDPDADAEAEDESQSQPVPMPAPSSSDSGRRHHHLTTNSTRAGTGPVSAPLARPSLSTSSASSSAVPVAAFVEMHQVSTSQMHQHQHQQQPQPQAHRQQTAQTIPTPPLSAGSSSGSHYSHHYPQHQTHTSTSASGNQYQSGHQPQQQQQEQQERQERRLHSRNILNNQQLPPHIQPYSGPHPSHPPILPASHHAQASVSVSSPHASSSSTSMISPILPQIPLPPLTTTTTPLSAATQEAAEIYRRRMTEHIATIRDFCSGLEYQLQFNDYRMLDQLEEEGRRFLRLARECLRKEGRWFGGSS